MLRVTSGQCSSWDELFFWQEIAGVPDWFLNNVFNEMYLLHSLNQQ